MTNRRRHHAKCLRLTDAEYDLWTAKQKASNLSKTDYLTQAILLLQLLCQKFKKLKNTKNTSNYKQPPKN